MSKKTSNSTFDAVTREGTHAILVHHTAVVVGASEGEPVNFEHSKPVRRFKIGQPRPYAQYPVSVTITFVSPGKRNWRSYNVTPDNLVYYTIENETGIIYDSRQDVPCDMEKFAATRQRFVKQWQDEGFTVIAGLP